MGNLVKHYPFSSNHADHSNHINSHAIVFLFLFNSNYDKSIVIIYQVNHSPGLSSLVLYFWFNF